MDFSKKKEKKRKKKGKERNGYCRKAKAILMLLCSNDYSKGEMASFSLILVHLESLDKIDWILVGY